MHWAHHSSRGVIPSVVCPASVIVKPREEEVMTRDGVEALKKIFRVLQKIICAPHQVKNISEFFGTPKSIAMFTTANVHILRQTNPVHAFSYNMHLVSFFIIILPSTLRS